ncbi:squamosa promoter binding protein-like 9 [Actinidia rufa]|uniref:Squamosa promoter binding protein-like 9 n=1 Tax=Actinidia rufa TaxID=165716 RepID=A0A7J0E2J9_9ERIC|nr:squamosa promoter binding protein-like 9 [Actinidia rufa]
MEMGSGSSSSSNSSDSLHGLKFGHKIYFEDGGTDASGGRPPVAAPRKGRSGAVQGGQPPRCQVEGCKVDLSDAKAYYSRHKVCGMHSKSPTVIVGGLEMRFCQQCSRDYFGLLDQAVNGGSINFLNLTKEKEVAADAWQATTSGGGSRHLDHYLPNALDDCLRPSLVRPQT